MFRCLTGVYRYRVCLDLGGYVSASCNFIVILRTVLKNGQITTELNCCLRVWSGWTILGKRVSPFLASVGLIQKSTRLGLLSRF